MSDVTNLLQQVQDGDEKASEKLLVRLYDDLRRQAAQQLSNEKAGHTLQTTALVHEAYLRLAKPKATSDQPEDVAWNSRGHFFAAAAEAMRRILVERARRKGAQKRGAKRGTS